jgi:3',5'-cyclic AMP phosphodiesterase CpdA
VGLVADPQYADIDPIVTRFYRQSIGKLTAAIEHFNALPLDFCVNVGDTIDKKWESFDAILAVFAKSKHKFHHILGNHDFDLLDPQKAGVPKRLNMEARYYSVTQNGFCFVMLDTNDVSIYAATLGSPEFTTALNAMRQFASTGAINAQPWNGAVGAKQMRWFEETCRKAAAAKQKVIVFAHHPVYPPLNNHNEWNSAALLQLVQRNRNIVAWINGHNHAGAFGIHDDVPFLTLKGMVETKDTNAFSVAKLYEDRLVITGTEREPSRELVFRKA